MNSSLLPSLISCRSPLRASRVMKQDGAKCWTIPCWWRLPAVKSSNSGQMSSVRRSERVAHMPLDKRPVVLLYGLAAVHPLGTPTDLMACVAETEPCDARTGRVVPTVVFVPGQQPPMTRSYRFLDPDSPLLPFPKGVSM